VKEDGDEAAGVGQLDVHQSRNEDVGSAANEFEKSCQCLRRHMILIWKRLTYGFLIQSNVLARCRVARYTKIGSILFLSHNKFKQAVLHKITV
jgi:hypothetical protein